MYSSIYRVQSSTRRLPIRALFGFTLKLVESYFLPLPSEPLVWWFVLGSALGRLNYPPTLGNISKLTFFGHRHDSSYPPVRVCTTLADSSTLCKGIDEAVYPHLLCPAWPATSQLCRPIRNIRSQCVKLITVDLLSNLGHDESSTATKLY